MKRKLVINGNEVYELDESCVSRKQREKWQTEEEKRARREASPKSRRGKR